MLSNKDNFNFTATGYETSIDATLSEIKNQKIVERIWNKDYTVWSDSPNEITNRLGWLHSPEHSKAALTEINKFVEEIQNEKFESALLLGMGGSSLAPEVFQNIFGYKAGYLKLSVLDSTDPGAVLNMTKKFDPAKTLYIVSTKSGGTVETISFMKYFYNFVLSKLGAEKAAKHFIAITDPGSGLQQMAEDLKFRKIFLNDPNIGGRYSALSLFGIVPAALVGINVEKILARAESAGVESKNETSTSGILGAIMGVLANVNVDKVTFITSPQINPFGAWVEQLIAESTGKIGKGILPVESESVESPELYSNDRLFVYIKLKNDSTFDGEVEKLKAAKFPVVEIIWNDLYDLGAEYMRWELATAIASWKIKIQPFDQPNVEAAKVLAREMIKTYKEKGNLPSLDSVVKENEITVYGDASGSNIKDAFNNFLQVLADKKAVPQKYLSIHAYLTPDAKATESLQEFRTKIQQKYKTATTVGYGPRFLHSTGQLHKGDAGNGLFIQFTSNAKEDTPIPDEAGKKESSISFGVLIKAQALGDYHALVDNERKVIRFDLGNDVLGGIKKLTDVIN
ncbi:MAG: glucose-6-phosphate isomerase [Bacteroidetes bacterium]|nr:glucose-6-phosphate isomerase [Bacteroidota bacterium]